MSSALKPLGQTALPLKVSLSCQRPLLPKHFTPGAASNLLSSMRTYIYMSLFNYQRLDGVLLCTNYSQIMSCLLTWYALICAATLVLSLSPVSHGWITQLTFIPLRCTDVRVTPVQRHIPYKSFKGSCQLG